MRSTPLLIALALLAVLAGSLSAQTPPAPAGGAGASDLPPWLRPVIADQFNEAATGKDVPVTGGRIVVGYDHEPKTIDNVLDNSAVTQYISGYVEDMLVDREFMEPFNYYPRLAEKMHVEDLVVRQDGTEVLGKVSDSADGVSVAPCAYQKPGAPPAQTVAVPKAQIKEVRRGCVITFEIRKNVKWHDGAPCDVRDVEFTFKVIKNPLLEQPHIQGYYSDLSRYEVLDDYTIRFIYDKQYWMALEVAGNNFFIWPKHIFNPDGEMEKNPEEWFKKFKVHPQHNEPIGTGPYKFVKGSWKKGVQLELERNKDYFLPERAGHLDRIVIRFITDNVALLQALKSGEVDFVTRLMPEQYWTETDTPEFKQNFVRAYYYYPYFGYVGWNCRKAPFNDKTVRTALGLAALDLDDFNRTVGHGMYVPVTGPQYFAGPAYNKEVKRLPYDPKKADELLMEAGWFDRDGDGIRDKDGVPFRFEFLMPETPPTAPGAQRAAIMQNNFKKLGIDMTVKQLEWGAFITAVEKIQFDACTLAWVLNPESDCYQIWHSSQTGEQGSNHVGFANEEADRLIEDARKEIDAPKRHEINKRLHALIYDEQPYFFLFNPPEYVTYRKKFRGVRLYRLKPGYDLLEWYIPKELQQ